MERVIETIRLVMTIILLAGASYTDMRCRKVRNVLTLPIIACGLVLCMLSPQKDLAYRILAIVALSLLGTLHLMGMGDLKMLMAAASLNGMYFALMSLFCGTGLMLVWCAMTDFQSLRLAVINVKNFFLYGTPIPTQGKTRYPFAVFLSAGSVMVMILERIVICGA